STPATAIAWWSVPPRPGRGREGARGERARHVPGVPLPGGRGPGPGDPRRRRAARRVRGRRVRAGLVPPPASCPRGLGVPRGGGRAGRARALLGRPAASGRGRGKPGLYHETITWAFVLLVQERRAPRGDEDWAAFAARNADLLAWKPSI